MRCATPFAGGAAGDCHVELELSGETEVEGFVRDVVDAAQKDGTPLAGPVKLAQRVWVDDQCVGWLVTVGDETTYATLAVGMDCSIVGVAEGLGFTP